MARKKPHVEQQSEHADPNHGHGGSYVNGEDGVRRLVERTEDRVPRNVEDANPPEKSDESPE